MSGRFPSASGIEIARLLLPMRLCARPLRATLAASDPVSQRVLWRTAAGVVWGNESDRETLELIATEQLLSVYQQGPVRVVRGDVVLDIGGHLGLFTRTALNAGASQVIVFEPVERHQHCLRTTFRAELAEGRIRLVSAGAWHSDSPIVLAPGHVTCDAEDAAAQHPRIEGRRIDTVVEELGLRGVDFIKMDIEGSQRHALAGARATLARWSPRLAICTYHLPDDPGVIRRLVHDASPSYREFVPSYPREQAYFFGSSSRHDGRRNPFPSSG